MSPPRRLIGLGLGAALLVGCVSGAPPLGSSPSSSASSVASSAPAAPSAAACGPADNFMCGVEAPGAGTWTIYNLDTTGIDITFTLPSLWARLVYASHTGLLKGDPSSPESAGITFVTGRINVYANPCEWSGTLPDPRTGDSVDALASALAAQEMHGSPVVSDVVMDGYEGKSLLLAVPTTLTAARDEFFECDAAEFRIWSHAEWDRRAQGLGQQNEFRILDVAGTRLIVDSWYYPDTSASIRAEYAAILESIQFSTHGGN